MPRINSSRLVKKAMEAARKVGARLVYIDTGVYKKDPGPMPNYIIGPRRPNLPHSDAPKPKKKK